MLRHHPIERCLFYAFHTASTSSRWSQCAMEVALYQWWAYKPVRIAASITPPVLPKMMDAPVSMPIKSSNEILLLCWSQYVPLESNGWIHELWWKYLCPCQEIRHCGNEPLHFFFPFRFCFLARTRVYRYGYDLTRIDAFFSLQSTF